MKSRQRLVLALFALALVAFATRFPQLWGVPSFGVEWEEVWLGFQIAFQHLRPATDHSKDIGPIFNYLVAEGFRLFGPDLRLPRLLTMTASILTVLMTFFIGREAFDDEVGALAALMLAFSGASIFLSHQAFSNALTPLAVALAGYATLLAERRSPYWLVPAGLLWGVALETDSSVLGILLPLFAYLVWRGRSRALATLAGVLAFLVGYAHMILLNIQDPLVSLHWILQRKGYAVAQSHGLGQIVFNYLFELLSWGQTLATAFPIPLSQVWLDALGLVAVVIWLTLFVGAVKRFWTGRVFPLFLTLTLGPLLVIPIFNKAYVYPEMSRYLVPILPFALTIVAWRIRILVKGSPATAKRWILIGTLAVMTAVWPAFSLAAYYGTQGQAQRGNAEAFRLTERARALGGASHPVYFDSTGFMARWYAYVLLSGGVDLTVVGDPWANGERGDFRTGVWRRFMTGSQGMRLALLSPAGFRRLGAQIPADARISRVAGPGGGYVVVVLGASPKPARSATGEGLGAPS